MTKRKRDIFTVIESINNWFEAIEPNTNTSEGPEGEAVGLGAIGTSSDHITTHSGVAEVAGSDYTEGPWIETVQVAPNQNHEGTECEPQSEVVARPAHCLALSTLPRW